MISNMTILHPTKRDGGIMNCFLNEDGEVVVDNNAVLKQCFETLGKLSTKVEPPELTDTYFLRLH